MKLDFDVAQEPEAANAQLQLSKQDVFGDGVFFFWVMIGEVVVYFISIVLGSGFIYLFVVFFLLFSWLLSDVWA